MDSVVEMGWYDENKRVVGFGGGGDLDDGCFREGSTEKLRSEENGKEDIPHVLGSD